MDEYATVPENIPSNAMIKQLDPIDLGGNQYHGWEMLFTKSVDTGKKDKQTGQKIISQQIDSSKKPKFDKVTALYKRDTALAQQNTKLAQFAMEMQLQVAKSNQPQGGNK